jgi:hypothetical protein
VGRSAFRWLVVGGWRTWSLKVERHGRLFVLSAVRGGSRRPLCSSPYPSRVMLAKSCLEQVDPLEWDWFVLSVLPVIVAVNE